MPKSRRNDPPKEGYQQLDIAVINDKLDKQFNQLEEMLGAMLEEMFKEMTKEMTKTLADAISGEQQETTSSGSQKWQGEKQEAELEQQDVDEGSDKEEGDSNGEVGFADSVEEPAENHISTGKDKKEDKESKKGQEVEEDKKVNATKVETAAKPKKEEKKEAKASTSNADKEKKKPAANKEEKEKVSEEVKGPTTEELRALLEEADFETVTRVTPADICQQLGAQFKVDMRDREEEVKQIKDDLINNVLLEAIDFEK